MHFVPHMGGFWCLVSFVPSRTGAGLWRLAFFEPEMPCFRRLVLFEPSRTDVDLVTSRSICVPDAMVLGVSFLFCPRFARAKKSLDG